jgi:hypothetical protein
MVDLLSADNCRSHTNALAVYSGKYNGCPMQRFIFNVCLISVNVNCLIIPGLDIYVYLDSGVFSWRSPMPGGTGSDYYINPAYNLPPYPWPPVNPASLGSLNSVVDKIVFSDAGFYNAPWYGGDGTFVETPNIDPPGQWYGIPTMHFRHVDSSFIVDPVAQTVTEHGLAEIVWADGHVKPLKQTQVTDAMFTRD